MWSPSCRLLSFSSSAPPDHTTLRLRLLLLPSPPPFSKAPTDCRVPSQTHPLLSSSDSLLNLRLLGLPLQPVPHLLCRAAVECVSNGTAAAATEAAAPCVLLGCRYLAARELRCVSSPWALDFVGVIGCAFGLMVFCRLPALQQGLEASEFVRRAMELRLVLG